MILRQHILYVYENRLSEEATTSFELDKLETCEKIKDSNDFFFVNFQLFNKNSMKNQRRKGTQDIRLRAPTPEKRNEWVDSIKQALKFLTQYEENDCPYDLYKNVLNLVYFILISFLQNIPLFKNIIDFPDVCFNIISYNQLLKSRQQYDFKLSEITAERKKNPTLPSEPRKITVDQRKITVDQKTSISKQETTSAKSNYTSTSTISSGSLHEKNSGEGFCAKMCQCFKSKPKRSDTYGSFYSQLD